MKARLSALALTLAALLVSAALAQEKGTPSKAKKAAAPPDEKAQMEAMLKAATPGEAHQKLDPLVGTFEAKVTMWTDPSKPPQESTGKAERKWVLGNRYIEEQFEGTFMGQPFLGIGYTGYDNVKKKYVSSWMDTAGTGIMMSTGTADASGKTTMSSTVDDPLTGKPQKVTMKMSAADADHQVFEMWGPAPNGKPYKMMEITYTRRGKM